LNLKTGDGHTESRKMMEDKLEDNISYTAGGATPASVYRVFRN
jgi:hypothetical protein